MFKVPLERPGALGMEQLIAADLIGCEVTGDHAVVADQIQVGFHIGQEVVHQFTAEL